jgi:hypothetical protein
MFDSLFRFLGRRGRPARRPKPRRSVTPRLEALEERWVPSATDGMMSLQGLVGGGGTLSNPPIAGSTQTSDTNAPPVTSGTQTQTATATFTAFKTGGSETQTVAQFNPSLGTLTGVQLIFNGQLSSDVKVENLDGAASNVNAQVNGNLTLQGPGFQAVSVSPAINESTTLSADDGTLDYGGSSGKDFGSQSAQASKTIDLTAGSNDLSAWIGTGAVSLTGGAQSTSTVSGSGNQQVHIDSTGGGTVQVIYSYTPAPPAAPPPVAPPAAPPPVTPTTNTCTPPSGPGSLAGIVYVDAGHLNHYVQGAAGLQGVTVNLHGTTVAGQSVNRTTTTAADGTYNFTNLQAGLYSLTDQLTPAQQAQYSSGAETLGSLGGALVGNEMIVALPQGSEGMCYDFGADPQSPPPASPPPLAPPLATPVSPPLAPPPVSPPPVSPPPSAPGNPSIPMIPPVGLSKRSLLGDGWQSLG